MKKLAIFITSLILAGLSVVIYFFIQIYIPASNQIQERNFIIQKGQGVNEISQNLKKANFIKNKFIFKTYVFLKKIEKNFQAGEYKLKLNMNIIQIAKILTSGIGVSNEREIKIIEGWTIQEITEYLEKEGIVSKNDFLKALEDMKKDIRILGYQKDNPPASTAKRGELTPFVKGEYEPTNPQLSTPSLQLLEGFLFPDTYRIYKNATPEDIIKKMLNNFDQKLTPELRQEIKKQNKTIFEIVTMASIIEKEVPLDKDRMIVSGIFWKRIESGMPLQADSTLNYFTGHKSRALSSEELKIDSFYNTYLYPDLPPTPIGNPGLSALRAAIYPEESPYWFFLSKEDGETIFSRTLEEHNRNKVESL